MKALLAAHLLMIVFAGCSGKRFAYTPSSHSVPVFSEKHDSRITANYSTDGGSASYSGKDSSELEQSKTGGYDVQAAFAITKHVAIQANYYFRDEYAQANSLSFFDDSKIRYKRNLMEFAVGYFGPLDKREHLYFQLYAGAAYGNLKITESGTDINQSAYNRALDANILKLYIEPSISIRTKIAFTGTIFTRASIVKFGNVRSNYVRNEGIDIKLDSLDRYSVLFFEPGFIASLGFRKLPGIRLEVQAALSIPTQKTFFGYRPACMSIGLAFDIPKLIKWEKYRPYKW